MYRWTGVALATAWITLGTGCKSPTAHRGEADRAAYDIIRDTQQSALGRTEPFSIEPPADTLRRRLLLDQHLQRSDPASLGGRDVARIPQWPDAAYGTNQPPSGTAVELAEPMRPTLLEALQIAARNSRDYQEQKEAVFIAALALDLERDAFRNTWTGMLDALFSSSGAEDRVNGSETSAGLSLERKLKTGGSFALNLGLDLVKLLTQDKASAFGAIADATLSQPLLRGTGRFVVTEPLTQAERNVVYAMYEFERFKRTFAVRVASDYLGVLQQLDQIDNARDNYERLVLSTRRARRLAAAGQMEGIEVDQAQQDELRARNRWISARIEYERSLDTFKLLLGLPPDAAIELDRTEMTRLIERAAPLLERARAGMTAQDAEAADLDRTADPSPADPEGGGPLELDEGTAVRLALEHRLDLRTRIGRILDAQRGVAVAADQLRADVSLLGRASAGESRSISSAGSDDADLSLSKGSYSLLLSFDLPLERTAERNLYRKSLIDFEKAVRSLQELEDQIKLGVRDDLRALMERRESVAIQALAVELARRRLDSTTMFLEAGRIEIRNVLEAEEALVSAQNALSAALVGYRVGELQLQRDMGVLEIDERGLWTEYVPDSAKDGEL